MHQKKMSMKTSGFKKKLTTPLKRTSLKAKTPLRASKINPKPIKAKKASKSGKPKKKRTTRQKLEKMLWEECKRIIRLRYPNTCYTSGAMNLTGANWHTGHGKSKGELPIRYKYDLRNLRPQSYHANINLGGMSDVFIAKLEQEEEGLKFLEESCRFIDGYWQIRKESDLGGKDATVFLENLLAEYKQIVL